MSNDQQFQIECLTTELIDILMEEYGWNMKKAFDELYNSQTFERLNDIKCGLYYESAPYIFSFLKNEIEKGKIE